MNIDVGVKLTDERDADGDYATEQEASDATAYRRIW